MSQKPYIIFEIKMEKKIFFIVWFKNAGNMCAVMLKNNYKRDSQCEYCEAITREVRLPAHTATNTRQ